jgi:hypothetical protein
MGWLRRRMSERGLQKRMLGTGMWRKFSMQDLWMNEKTIYILHDCDLSVVVPMAWIKINFFLFTIDISWTAEFSFIVDMRLWSIKWVSPKKIIAEMTRIHETATVNPELRNLWCLWWETIQDKSLKDNKRSQSCHYKRLIKYFYVSL